MLRNIFLLGFFLIAVSAPLTKAQNKAQDFGATPLALDSKTIAEINLKEPKPKQLPIDLIGKASKNPSNITPPALRSKASEAKSDKITSLRLKPFPVIYNQEVKNWAIFFTQNQTFYTKLWLKRAYRYFPLMEKILRAQGLPAELTAMTLVESALSPRATSPAQAVGYWQFIPSTAKRYGLTINDWIDERQDFQKSAVSAGKYLYKLYGDFEDWLLVMSAYNMGEKRLKGLIKKHRTKNFWRLRAKADFPKETALYVPKVLAAGRIVKNPERYGWSEFQVLAPYSYDVFFIPGGIHLEEIALNAGISLWKLKDLNPELKKGMAPKSVSLYQIRLPKGSGLRVSQWLDKQNLL